MTSIQDEGKSGDSADDLALSLVVRPVNQRPESLPQQVFGIRRALYWILAGFFFVLAMIGVVLPGIPTTPFLLLMCFFLLRVSPALHAKAMSWPVVGGPLRDWRDQGGVRMRVKVLAICMVTGLVGSTLLFSALGLVIKLVILIAAASGVYVVVRLPTAHDER